MTNTKLTNQAQIEGLLFISGDEGITLGDLAKISGFMKLKNSFISPEAASA